MKTLVSRFILFALATALLIAAPVVAQDRFNAQTGQWEYTPQPNVPAGGGAAIDDRTGTFFAPSGDGGKMNTRDGTQWNRSGDTLINSRTGQMYHDPHYKENSRTGQMYHDPHYKE